MRRLPTWKAARPGVLPYGSRAKHCPPRAFLRTNYSATGYCFRCPGHGIFRLNKAHTVFLAYFHQKMAATAQNHMEPLRSEGKKDNDEFDEERECECRRVLERAGVQPRGADRGAPLPAAVEYSPFYGIEKGLVLQETRVFNEPHVDPRRCQQVITKLLYLLTQGETFTKVRCHKMVCCGQLNRR